MKLYECHEAKDKCIVRQYAERLIQIQKPIDTAPSKTLKKVDIGLTLHPDVTIGSDEKEHKQPQIEGITLLCLPCAQQPP